MYKLSNNQIIDEDTLLRGLDDNDPANHYFLDIEKGHVISVSEDAVTARLESTRFVEVPKIQPQQEFGWMRSFVDDFVACEDPEAEKKLAVVLQEESRSRRFQQVLEEVQNGWSDAWNNWKLDCLYEELQKWLASLPIEIIDEIEWFDDCAVCQVMAKGLPTMEDLTQAFDKANKPKAN